MARSKHIGEFEQMVLLAVLQRGQRANGYEVRKELELVADRPVSKGAFYITLNRLEEKGYLTWEVREPTEARSRLPQRHFAVTPDGLDQLRRSRKTLRSSGPGSSTFSMSDHVHPPERADRLLERVLPDGVEGLTILGDLHEEFRDVALEHGEGRARRWYWRGAVGLWFRFGAFRSVRAARTCELRGGEAMSSVLADLKFGIRMLGRTPGLSMLAILTVALGIGLTTHAYSYIYGVVIRGIDVPDADRFVALVERDIERDRENWTVSYLDLLDLKAQLPGLESIAGLSEGTINLAGEDAPPERFNGAFVTANALSVVGVEPLLGRVFREGEDGIAATPRIVLSERVWRNRFGADSDIIGETIRANGATTEIIGVMPEPFGFPIEAELWLPVPFDANADDRSSQRLVPFGRVAAGVDRDVADASLAQFSQQLADIYPETNRGKVLATMPFTDRYVPSALPRALSLGLLASFGVLLIVCANVANLLLARASIRTREVAIRTAMGASRGRIVRQMLVEVGLITILGGVIGVVIAHFGVEAVEASFVGIRRPYWMEVSVDGRALSFAFSVAAVASLAAGVHPALRASGVAIDSVLRDESRGSSSLRLGRFSNSLVVTEVAVSCGLLIAAGFMIKGVANLRTMDLGFEPESVLIGRVALFDAEYPTPEDRVRFFEEMESRLEGINGVAGAALASVEPGLGSRRWTVAIDGESYGSLRDYPVVRGNIVTSGFFDAIGAEFLQGRDFLPSEVWDESAAVAIVNQSFVNRVLGGREAIGERVRIEGDNSANAYASIIGVVGDTYIGGGVGGIGSDQLDPQMMYVGPAALAVRSMSAILETVGPPSSLAPELRRAVMELDPNLPVYGVGPLSEAIDDATWAFGLFGSVFAVSGIVALLLATAGLYGVIAFSVNQRRREMGVRMALGAAPDSIRRMVLARGVRQLTVGMLLGVGLGYALGGPLSAVTFGVETNDLSVYGAIVTTLGLAGLLATIVPAYSATRTDPLEVMRT